jgi:hypothetical protein
MKYFIMVFERDPFRTYTEFHQDFISHVQIKAWWHFVTSGYLIVTELTAIELSLHAAQIFEHYKLPNLHLVLKVNFDDYNGILPREAWDWIIGQSKNQWAEAKRNLGPGS